MRYQLQIDIAGLPVGLILLSDGTLAFVRKSDFKTIIDYSVENNVGIFSKDSFYLGESEYNYNVAYNYKEIPDMLNWLKAQNLQEPVVIF